MLGMSYFRKNYCCIRHAQTMTKSTKHAHLDDIREVWLSRRRHGSTFHGPPLVCCFFPLGFGNVGQKFQKHRENTNNFCNAVSFLPFCFRIQLTNQNKKTNIPQNEKNNRKNNSIEVHDWLNHRVVFLVCELDAKTKEQNADNIKEID